MKGRILGLGLSATLALAATLAPMRAPGQKKAPAKTSLPSFERDVAPVVETYCVSCHAGKDAPGGVILKKGMTAGVARTQSALWGKVARNVASMHMPPQGMPAPSRAQRARLAQWVDSAFAQDCRLADPGRVTIRRLNRAEYDNTVRDLIGVDSHPSADFPSDDVGYGFDNIGDVLSISPLLMEKYMAAAERLSRAAIRVPKGRTLTLAGGEFAESPGCTARDGLLFFYAGGTASASLRASGEGWYTLRFRLGEQPAGPEHAKLEVKVDDLALTTIEVPALATSPGWYEVPARLAAGAHTIRARFENDYYRPKTATTPAEDRNLALFAMECVGPKETVASVPKVHKWLIPATPKGEEQEGSARKALAAFASRAYRRPVSSEETDRLMTVYKLVRRSGEPYERAIQVGVQAVLASPSFLFRVELDAAPSDPRAKRQLTGYELASRLSYFLWSSMPDARLEALAASGEIGKPAVLKAEVARMLKDPKAEGLTENFATQWLQLRKLATFQPEKAQFPTFDEGLRTSMLKETTTFFDNIRENDGSILDFLGSKYAFVDGRLAKLYGIPNVTGDAMRKVAVTDPNRGGLMTQAAVLTISSNPTRTSPTKRGKWILEAILGTPPPPPPPGVGQLKDDKAFTATMTLRERMQEHRKNPVCASCHTKMDTIGFGFENFDAIGRWRTQDGAFKVDPAGKMPDGKAFSTPAGLKAILMGQKDLFARGLAEHLTTFALGRGLEDADKCAIDLVAKKTKEGGYRFSALVQAVVESDPFRKRRGDGTPK